MRVGVRGLALAGYGNELHGLGIAIEDVQAGRYEIPTGLTARDALAALIESGPLGADFVTVANGECDPDLVRTGGLSPTDSIAAFLIPYLTRGELRMVAEATPSELDACRRLLDEAIRLAKLLASLRKADPGVRSLAAHGSAKNTPAGATRVFNHGTDDRHHSWLVRERVFDVFPRGPQEPRTALVKLILGLQPNADVSLFMLPILAIFAYFILRGVNRRTKEAI